MSKWITDRRPTSDDGVMVYGPDGGIWRWQFIHIGEPWKPIPNCEPYVKPKRFCASWDHLRGWWRIDFDGKWFEYLMRLDKQNDECRAAAERIAATYEEVMP